MYSYSQLLELRDAAYKAYMKALEAESYSIGDGSNARSLNRASVASLKKELDTWTAQLAAHPDSAAAAQVGSGRGVRRITNIL